MAIALRQSTASQEIPIGYFLDSTNGNDEETGLTIANTDIKLWKSGATTLANKNSGGATHISNGIYYAVLDATDTDTVGGLVVFCHPTGALATRTECYVLEEAVFDALFAASAAGYQVPIWAAANSTVSLSGTTVATVTTTTTATNLTNERGKYALGSVWIGPSANTNTVSYTDGIITNPVSTIAAAKTIADALLLRKFQIVRSGAVQIGADMVGYDFDGSQWSCTTTGGSRDVSSSSFRNALVIGGTYASTSAASYWSDCEFATGVSIAAVNMQRCTFAGTTTFNAAGNYDLIDCASVVAGTGTPVFAVPAGTVNISFRRWSGGISLTGITSGTTISIDMVSGGTVTLAGADGNVQIRGMVAGITDNRTGTPTLGQNAAINITKINTEADTALSDYGALKPTTAGRTLDVTATGAAGIDWGNVEGQAVSVDLSNTIVQTVATVSSTNLVQSLASNVITAAALAADAVTEIQSGLATASALATVDDFIDTEVTAIKAVTDKLDTALELDVAVYRFTTNALEQAPSGTGASAETIADAVWDEVLSGHLTAGTTGNALNAAGSAGDPWSTALPGAYGAGTAGKLIGDNINAPIGTVDTVVDAIKAKTDNLPSDPADQSAVEAAITAATSPLATAAALATVDDFLDTEIAAILADTNELQVDWVNGGRLDLLIDAIKAKTDNLPATPAATGDAMTLATDAVSSAALSAAAVDEILDEIVEGSTTVRQVLRALLSLAAGKTTRAGSTIYFRDFGDTKNRLSLTVDTNADRTSVSTDLT